MGTRKGVLWQRVASKNKLQATTIYTHNSSHQVSSTRTRGRQQRGFPLWQCLTSSADESKMFDLPPCLAASDVVIRPKLPLHFLISPQKAGFPGSFVNSIFNSCRMLFPMADRIARQVVERGTHLFQASISSSCKHTSLSSFRHVIISVCRRPANGRNTTSFTTHPRSSTALLTTSP